MADKRTVNMTEAESKYVITADVATVNGTKKDNTFLIDRSKPLPNEVTINGGGGHDVVKVIHRGFVRVSSDGRLLELMNAAGVAISTVHLHGIENLQLVDDGGHVISVPGTFGGETPSRRR